MADLLALDPADLWRPPLHQIDENTRLSHLDALGRTSLFRHAADKLAADPDPRSRLFVEMVDRALHAHVHEREPLGRALGTQPPAGLSARWAALQAERDRLLHTARASRPEWRTASAARAAQLIDAAWQRYAATVWPQAREDRDTAPAVEPQASFWRLCRLEAGGGPKAVGSERIRQILQLADGPMDRPEQLPLL
ncbi:hypothetical protein LV780_03775 [Cereibacter azotoformans]|uniref:Uncharacterized protein n=1 Tax=Cereibacter azotoformans TaxID=43057 RepID=A0A2T5JWP7_9RHOB|nr:hypothetical protein [Cereibacter azotoformans]AXQ93006.1 hypothetical protein D0Z66_03765 [Cereibacter sphaeroides]MBO4169305.1 hypothetical protein [Cereibacter azotoformans]PTR14595.1 hypothetical protein C8J28_11667 [Cereibacter azotoformans]UIJ31307.1 hypothetical protein LV780_03775 [Cereibacter azotoformans]